MSELVHDSPSVPESVGPYRIAGRLGIGGMGEVYRARDERLERWVAIKHIRPGESDSRSRERLRREARAVASLNHPAIVQVHDIVESDNGDWVVMELIEGRTLQELIDDRAVDLTAVTQLAREIAEGLAEAHAKGVIHRDLKTENVMVTKAGHAKILDFGLAKKLWHGRNEASLSVQGAILGTGRAMSPEQVLGEEVDHRSDLFSFGTLLFETVTGRRPFVGSSLIITLAQVCTEEQPSAHEVNPEVSRELSDLIDHLLQKDPLQRPQSAGEVVEALKRITNRSAAPSVSTLGDQPSDTEVAPAVVAPPTPPLIEPRTPGLPIARAVSRSSGSRASESTAGIFIKTLVQLVLVDSEDLGNRFGDARAYEIYARHDRLARDLLADYEGLEIHKTEGFLFLFERPVDAVEFVLNYHKKLVDLSAEIGVDLEARAGIHLSEVFLRENAPEDIHRGAKPIEVEGLAKLLVARVAALGRGGQTLLTQEAYDMARRALVGHRLDEKQLFWKSHGRYLCTGVDEVVHIFEVSTEEIPTDAAPPDSADVHRVEDGQDGPVRQPGGQKLLLALAAILVVALGGAAVIDRLSGPAIEDAGSAPPVDPPVETPAIGTAGMVRSPELESRPSLGVLGFRNLSASAEDAWMATALAELMATELRAGDDLRLVPGETVSRLSMTFASDTLAKDTLLRIYDKTGADFVILGSYLKLEDGMLRIQMNLQDTRLGETIATITKTGPKMLNLVAETSQIVREKLQISQTLEGEQALRATLSENAEANQLYFSGIDLLRSYRPLAARDMFQQAVGLDPEFTLAWASLGAAWLTLGYDKEAEESTSRAYELAKQNKNFPRKEFLWVEGGYYEAAGRWQEAIKTHQVLWGFDQRNVDYGLRLAELQIAANLDEDALRTVKALRSLPLPEREDPRIDIAEAAAAVGLRDVNRILEASKNAIDKGSENHLKSLVAEAQRLRGLALRLLKKPEEATVAFDEAKRLFTETGDEQGIARTLVSYSILLQGERKFSRAVEQMREALAIHRKTGSRRNIALIQNPLAYYMAGKGELEEAKAILEEALAVNQKFKYREQEVATLDTLVWVLVQLGENERAKRLGQELLVLCRELGKYEVEVLGYYSLGHIAMSEGRLLEAEVYFDKMISMAKARGNLDHLLVLGYGALGAVMYIKGDGQQAESYFESYWKLREAIGDWGEQSTMEQYYVVMLFEKGKVEEAQEWGEKIARRFIDSGGLDYAAEVLAILAQGQWQEGHYEMARETLARARGLRDRFEVTTARFRVEAAEAFFLTRSDYGKAAHRLRSLMGEAKKRNLRVLEFEIRLMLGRIGLEYGVTAEDRVNGRAMLESVAQDARRLSLGAVARRAVQIAAQGSR